MVQVQYGPLRRFEGLPSLKVLAINASQRASGQSKTQLLMEPLLEGMRQAGAEVETIHLRQKNIHPCVACISCWISTPGRCVQQDDMTLELYPKWLASDLVVYATPVYHLTLSSSLKMFFERTLPVVEPYWIEEGGRMTHPYRQQTPAAVVLATSTFPEEAVFGPLSSYMRLLCRAGMARTLLAEIYRPAAESLVGRRQARKRGEVLAAAEQAGREIIRDGKVSEATMAKICQPIGDPADLARTANAVWRNVIERGFRLER